MNEFNPFDDLGITFDEQNENLYENRRDRSYTDGWKYNPFDMNENIEVNTNVEPEYQPDFEKPLVEIDNPKDLQVAQELWIIIPDPLTDDEKQNYVDSLSNEDWKTWNELKKEGYSFEARKAMFDNREDLYDITEPWNKKFWSWNKNSFMQSLLDQQQDVMDFQEDVIHPWSMTAQDWLDVQAADLMDYKFEDIYQEKYEDMLNTDNKLLQAAKRAAMLPDSIIKRWAAVAWWLLFDLASKAVNLVDNLWNISTQIDAWVLNSIADEKKGYNLIINDPSKEPTIFWSYVEAVWDVLGVWFTIYYPLATYILSVLGSEVDWVWEWMEAINNWIKGVYKWIHEKTWLDQYLINNLTEEEQEQYYDNIVMATFIIISALGWEGIRSMSKTDLYKNFQKINEISRETSKIWLKEGIKEVQDTKTMMESQPEWTELKTKGWTKMMETTANGVKITLYWKLRILQKLLGRQFNWYKRWFEWAWEQLKNKNKLVTRDPNAPVWELPVVKTPDLREKNGTEISIEERKPIEEIKEKIPTEDVNTSEVKAPEVKTPTTTKPVTKKVDTSWNQTIWEYIKKIMNDITGKKGWMNKDLYEKFTSSKDLQSEYINTIDPYLRANWAENPEWVIEHQLNDFIETVKDQLQDRRNKNIDFRKGQMKYKVQIPESEKAQWIKDDLEIQSLIKILSKDSDNPEKFLEYLLKLPKEKTQAFNKLIPDFSKNLGLIKDTLDLTKAITSKDLLWKFLQFKSTWWTRNRNFIRKYLYKKLNEAYKKAWVQYNMKQIENIINQMTEEELVQLEKEIDSWEIRAFNSEAEFNDLLEKGYTPDTWIPANQNLEEIMNSKWPGTNKTTRDYLKEKGVQLSVTDDYWLRKIWWNIQAAYSAKLDRILMKTENNPYKWIVYHEFGHRVLSQLGTTQIMDIVSHIAKRDNITQEAAFERRAEYFRNYLQYNNVDWKKYLIKNLGDDITSKINATMEKTKEEIWDLFDLNEWDKNINQILSDVKHDTPRWQDITSRRPEPLIKDMVGDLNPVRYDYLRTIDPNIESVDIYPYFDKPIEIRFKDGSTKKWEEYRKTLTEEQLNEIDTYETDFIQEYVDDILGKNKWFRGEGNFNYDTLKNEKDLTNILMDETLKNMESIKKSLWLNNLEAVNYMKSLREIDPDIIGLLEKDGKLYVKYMIDSNVERWELPDRPWYVEIKEVPAKDYFTEEELNQLPKDLIDKIKKDAD